MTCVDWLEANEKMLYGINASFKDASDLSGFTRKELMNAVHQSGLKYWRQPVEKGTPIKPTKEVSLDWKDWEKVQVFFRRNHNIITEPGTTVGFIIRLMRSKRIPANEHIVCEMLHHRKITLKGVEYGIQGATG